MVIQYLFLALIVGLGTTALLAALLSQFGLVHGGKIHGDESCEAISLNRNGQSSDRGTEHAESQGYSTSRSLSAST